MLHPGALYHFTIAFVGVVLLAAGMEGYLVRVGEIAWWGRPLLVVGGVLITFPDWKTDLAGAVLSLIPIAVHLLARKRSPRGSPAGR